MYPPFLNIGLWIALCITLNLSYCNSSPPNIILTNNQVINMIFNAFDADTDGYLDQYECTNLQHETNPSLPLHWRDYQAICKMTNAIYMLGLNRREFSMTYTELSSNLGSNLHEDFKILLQKNIITEYQIYNYYRTA